MNAITKDLFDHFPINWDSGSLKSGANSARPWCSASTWTLRYSPQWTGARKILSAWQLKFAEFGSKCIAVRVFSDADVAMFIDYIREFVRIHNTNNNATTMNLNETNLLPSPTIPKPRITLVVNQEEEPDAIAVEGENSYDFRFVICICLCQSLSLSFG